MKSMKSILFVFGGCALIAGAYYFYNKGNVVKHDDVKIQAGADNAIARNNVGVGGTPQTRGTGTPGKNSN